MALKAWRLIKRKISKFVHDERGITGLETAIVLIAFVVVAAVFAFTVLTTGLFTSEKAKETALAGVAAASSTLSIKGSITAAGGPIVAPPGGQACPPACTLVDHIRVKITSATDVNDVPFAPTSILVTYMDDANVELMTFLANDPTIPAGIALCRDTVNNADRNWCLDWAASPNNDAIMEPGEIAELYIFTGNLQTSLGANSQFRVEIIPQEGAALTFQRRTPLSIDPVMNLD